jgi:thiamine biosynthesis lipoprotein
LPASTFERTVSSMGTVVSFKVVGHESEREAAVARAEGWFLRIDDECSRFKPESEVSRLAARAGEAVVVSPLLFEVVQFALAIAAASGGAFDPTLGADGASWRDIALDAEASTITLSRPIILDLGGVAKGLAVDLAARELAPLENFAVNAGGDLFLAGTNARGEPWAIGIQHPREPEQLIETLHLSNTAICTSGDYERGAHIMNPRSGAPAGGLLSVTVVAPSAMVADALGTAAFVLGPVDGAAFLRSQDVRGILFTNALERIDTP